MPGFIAGATSTVRPVASSTADARSSAWPPAIFAMRSAVAGATDDVGLAREPDMADVEFGRSIEQIGERLLAAERAGGKRRDEFLRRRGENAAHGEPRSFSLRISSSDL